MIPYGHGSTIYDSTSQSAMYMVFIFTGLNIFFEIPLDCNESRRVVSLNRKTKTVADQAIINETINRGKDITISKK
jgi:hypothetical protein